MNRLEDLALTMMSMTSSREATAVLQSYLEGRDEVVFGPLPIQGEPAESNQVRMVKAETARYQMSKYDHEEVEA